MNTLSKVQQAMTDGFVSVPRETLEKVHAAYDVETCIEILAREYPQMAQAIAFLRVIEILRV